MTRANITIITGQGNFKFQANSSAYPSWMMENLLKFATSTATTNSNFNGEIWFYDEPDSFNLSDFINSCGLTLGHVGNPSYFYEINFVKQTVKVWDYKTRWVNAPTLWKEKGYHCYQNKDGVWGWTVFGKGKVIYKKGLKELVKAVKGSDVILFDNVVEEAEKITG